MTTYPFSPVDFAFPPWQSQMILDGTSYKVVAYWNIYGQRWYITLTDAQNNVKWTGPVIGSSDSFNVYLAPGIFTTSTLLYRASTGNFEVGP